jgi:hypothetical protein
MIGVLTRGATHNYGPPENWDEAKHGVCHTLSVRVGTTPEGLRECVSTWKPSVVEIEHMMRGGVVVLSILGNQPPVSLTVEDRP